MPQPRQSSALPAALKVVSSGADILESLWPCVSEPTGFWGCRGGASRQRPWSGAHAGQLPGSSRGLPMGVLQQVEGPGVLGLGTDVKERREPDASFEGRERLGSALSEK